MNENVNTFLQQVSRQGSSWHDFDGDWFINFSMFSFCSVWKHGKSGGHNGGDISEKLCVSVSVENPSRIFLILSLKKVANWFARDFSDAWFGSDLFGVLFKTRWRVCQSFLGLSLFSFLFTTFSLVFGLTVVYHWVAPGDLPSEPSPI